MIPSWYDVLGVEPDATDDEIRSAWKASVTDLEPSDRRFKQRNRAAEVLLDPERRAAHDAELAAELAAEEAADDDAGEAEPRPAVTLDKGAGPVEAETADPAEDAAAEDAAEDADDAAAADADPPAKGPVRLAVGLAVLAVVLAVATVVSLVTGPGDAADDELPDAREVAAAREAAETAIGPVLSYDFRNLEEGFAAARPYLSERFAAEFDDFTEVVAANATETKSIVTTDVLSSGVVRTAEDRVDVLVFVDRPTKNAGKDTVYRDQVTLRMIDDDDRWLVDCLITQASGACED